MGHSQRRKGGRGYDHTNPGAPVWRAEAKRLGPEWCPRPDKEHHRSRQAAQRHMDHMQAKRAGDVAPHVYPCPCGMGWVWGRHHPPDRVV